MLQTTYISSGTPTGSRTVFSASLSPGAHTAAVGVAAFSTAAALPQRLRPWFLGAALVVEALTVATNAREGLRVSLP